MLFRSFAVEYLTHPPPSDLTSVDTNHGSSLPVFSSSAPSIGAIASDTETSHPDHIAIMVTRNEGDTSPVSPEPEPTVEAMTSAIPSEDLGVRSNIAIYMDSVHLFCLIDFDPGTCSRY